jgi:hypothetical protein
MQPEQLRRPVVVIASAILLVVGALVREVPAQQLLFLSASLEPRWYFKTYYPGSWAVTPLLIVLALCVFRGFAWSRYAVLVLVTGFLLAQWSFGLAPKYGNFAFAMLQETVSSAILASASLLLVLPSAGKWFGRRGVRGDA